ncbi:MAG: helix-turn-helix domain-containing protein [Verrucomicrobia bacterium]|nr:helix-turn-helix domain-containing protein [Verrucomicrobiota bacterium]
MGISDKLRDLEKRKAELVAREKELSAERSAALRRLPADFGYGSLAEFMSALRKAHRGAPKRADAAKRTGRRRRAKITEEIRNAVKKLVQEKKTGSAIAKELQISLPTVQNIKKKFGLVRPRAKAAS